MNSFILLGVRANQRGWPAIPRHQIRSILLRRYLTRHGSPHLGKNTFLLDSIMEPAPGTYRVL